MESLKYPPHFSLAFYEHLDRGFMSEAIDSVADQCSVLSIRFDSLDHFETDHSVVLWAKPARDDALILLHQRIHGAIPAPNIRPAYGPNVWVPHCSLATSIKPQNRAEAVALTRTKIEPFTVQFDTLDFVSFYPVEIEHERKLLPPNE